MYQFPDFSRYRAVISADGKVLWEPAGVFETSCKIDITFYPYDTQVCRADVVRSQRPMICMHCVQKNVHLVIF